MMTDPIKQYLRHYGVDVDLKTVTVEPLPVELRLCLSAANRECFANAANYLFNLQIQGLKDLHYVLGYSFNIIPLEHAIIRVGNCYYDPIREGRVIGDHFVPLWEFSADQLAEFVVANDGPPTFRDWIRKVQPEKKPHCGA